MKSCHQSCLASLFVFFLFSSSFAQNLRTFNQNTAGSNSRLSISFSPVYSTGIERKNDSLLFRGDGAGFRFGAEYFFGKAGFGFSSGFGSSSPDETSINKFISRTSFPPDQLIISKAKQQNMYLLFGPAIRFGKTIELFAHAKGGLFINNSGLISIQQKGAQRSLYRNESTAKSIYPGFLSGLGVQYKTRSDIWSFGIGLDYMSTRSQVNNYDARRGGGIEALKLSRNIADLVTGITVRYNIPSSRDHASGQASGKRNAGDGNSVDQTMSREAGSGLATGKRTYKPGQPVYGNINSEGTANVNCGAVKQTITNADGTTGEMTFACPADAADYNNKMKIDGGMPNRISMNVTVPRQTQGATFGEKVNAGLHAAGGAMVQEVPSRGVIHRDVAARNIISGRLTWTSGSSTGIITNQTIAERSVSNLSGGGSGAAAASYAATGRMTNNAPGVVTTLYAREAGSGMASGKRSRERGSGLSTGRRQYEPVFAEGQSVVCNPCIAVAKMASINNNPLYNDKGQQGNNPLYEGKTTADGSDDDSDGISGIMVSLADSESGVVVAKTITEPGGDFFFANVPDGNYVVKLSGRYISKKGYDYYAANSKTDLLGKIELGDGSMQLIINTGNVNDAMTQKAGISTSRSNIRSKTLTIIEADLDGDGEFESLSATGTFSDGSSQDISSAARQTISNASGTKGIVLDGNTMQMTRRRVEVLKSNKQGDAGANRITSVSVLKSAGRLIATGTFSDGSTRDVTEGLEVNTDHARVKQYTITISDLDDDGMADAVVKTKTKSNQSNDRKANGDTDDDGATEAVIKTKTKSNQSNDRMATGNADNEEVWSPRSNIKLLKLATGDVDGDGIQEMFVAAPFVPGGSVVTAAMRPGSPIGGLAIKGGKNPGGNLRTTQTNENGEFEFTNLEAGDYTFTVEQKIFIDDETPVTLGGNNTRVQDHNSSRSNKSSTIIAGGSDNGNMKVQDHNSSRSNKTASIFAGDSDNDNMKVQDHNSSRSNKTASSLADDPDYENNDNKKENAGPVKWMAPESLKQRVNTSRSNIRNIISSLDDLEKQLEIDASNEKRLVNTSRSNIKNQRMMMLELQETLAGMEYIDKETAMHEVNRKMKEMNTQFQTLQQSIAALGGQYSSISNVLKTRHDIAMNSIRNMK